MKTCRHFGGPFSGFRVARCTKRGENHGMSRTSEYWAWYKMLQRCTDTRLKDYPSYGGRGITVCESWKNFQQFLRDMGLKPSASHSIERINNDGNYEPSNCKWGTKKEQANNRRGIWSAEDKAKVLEGIALCLSNEEIAETIGKTKEAVSGLTYKSGWRRTPEQMSILHQKAQLKKMIDLMEWT